MHLDAKLPLLVFGGPYSNLRALAALRQRAGELGIPASQTICTGDVVAYCAEPEETTPAIRDWGCHVIAGNCEEQLAAAAEDCACGFEPGTECDHARQGLVSLRQRAHVAREPRLDGGAAEDDHVHRRRPEISASSTAASTSSTASCSPRSAMCLPRN